MNDQVLITVEVDLLNDCLQVDGDMEHLKQLMSERDLDMDYKVFFKEMTKFFVENKIKDPQKYAEKLLK